MRHLGLLDAEVTRHSGDGGIDVVSATHVAQVKNYAGTVGVEKVRQIFGVAVADKKLALVFTSGTFTVDALIFASRVEIPLVQYNAVAGTIRGANSEGTNLVEYGFDEVQTQS
jgi:HJR/Mrr/RecB family endonuclease